MKAQRSKVYKNILLVMIAIPAITLSFNYAQSTIAIESMAFNRLASLRAEQKERLESFFHRQRARAEEVRTNEQLERLFLAMLRIRRAGEGGSVAGQRVQKGLDVLFVNELGMFYDMLFVDLQGKFFHTVRKEDDFLQNLNDHKFSDSLLARAFKQTPKQVTFVDFEYYHPSQEAAAFFIVPVTHENRLNGYIVLQLALNGINDILINYGRPGRSGETYLVNAHSRLLTESRFLEDDKLQQRVTTEAVDQALRSGQEGTRLLRDYRNKRVFSAFETFTFMESRWVLIAEQDLDEVVTETLLEEMDRLFPRIIERLQSHRYHPLAVSDRLFRSTNGESVKRVDVGEFKRASGEKVLITQGVSTCTGVTAHIPGQFGYMAHVTPTDYVYGHDFWTRWFLGDHGSNRVEELVKRITWNDIPPAQRGRIRFTVHATHMHSLQGVVAQLLKQGIDLSQIDVVIRQEKQSVSLLMDHRKNRILSLWRDTTGQMEQVEMAQFANLGTLAEEVLGVR
ncbi:MAG: cache domain-containing protein [Magnetococcales bacterium]|nr:cache domain-containing protein [Magnetococcales bacterium]